MKRRSIAQPSVYLSKVRPKQNHSWKLGEMLNIYTLRKEERKSAREIALRRSISVYQVYNVIRLVKKGLARKCYKCGKKLSNAEQESNNFLKLCDSCKEEVLAYKRKRRQKALKRGLCGYCEKSPVISGFKACVKCISSTQRRRNQEGLCGYCGKEPISTKSLCKSCAEMIKDKVRTRRHGVEQI